MKLLSGKELNRTQYPGIIRHEHIYNDYHWKQTNPGYSRNPMGGKMFTKWDYLVSSMFCLIMWFE